MSDPKQKMKDMRSFVAMIQPIMASGEKPNGWAHLAEVNFSPEDKDRLIIALQDALTECQEKKTKAEKHIMSRNDQIDTLREISSHQHQTAYLNRISIDAASKRIDTLVEDSCLLSKELDEMTEKYEAAMVLLREHMKE